jgi:methionyl-tRNA formyltransferase
VAAEQRAECELVEHDADADLGLSLGNGYIGERVFSIPRHGMINLHSEVLPAFQGASAVIWPIYENVAETGFTIHQVNRKIDEGDILLQEKWPIVFHDSLRKTVEANLVPGRERSPAAIVKVCTDYATLKQNAVKQTGGKSYTTPSFWQFLRMVRNHSRMRAARAAGTTL